MRSSLRRALVVLTALMVSTLALAPATIAASPTSKLTADLDGRPIALIDVAKYACQDIDYPHIHCYSTNSARDASAASLLASPSSTYVIVWEDASYAGASLIISQDYTVLATLGWNDRISSFKAQNSQSGRFWTDWFYGGTAYYFCCNSQVGYVGDAYNDTFSSVQRQ